MTLFRCLKKIRAIEIFYLSQNEDKLKVENLSPISFYIFVKVIIICNIFISVEFYLI